MCYCPDDNGVTDFSSTTYPVARKPHRCAECHTTIAPGTRYVRTAQKWEGEVSATTFCVDCDAWAGALCKAQAVVCGCSGWELRLWGEIAEFSAEHLGYDPETGDETPDGFDADLLKVVWS